MSPLDPDDRIDWQPSGRSRRVALDCLGWGLFALGLIGMFGVVMLSLLSEGDGDFRTWDTIRKQVRMLFGCGVLAIGGPAAVWLLQKWLDRGIRSRKPDRPGDPLDW
jgi:hypothetical protein